MDFKSRKKHIIGGVVIVAAIFVLILNALSSCSVRSYTVTQLLEKGDAVYGETVHLDGEVAAGSVVRETELLLIEFVLVDENDVDVIRVSFTGNEPDNFSEGRGVTLRGKMDDNGHFVADEILTQCASKYVPEE